MKSTKRALGFGILTWLLPFVVAVAVFPLKKAGDPLFETIMPLVVTFCALLFANLYFKRVTGNFVKEGVLLGSIWLCISLVVDLCMFMQGPMKMPFSAYLKDIGLGYLIFPTITIGAGWLLHCRTATDSEQARPTDQTRLKLHDEAVHA